MCPYQLFLILIKLWTYKTNFLNLAICLAFLKLRFTLQYICYMGEIHEPTMAGN